MKGTIDGVSHSQAIYSAFYLEMYNNVVNNGSIAWEKVLESIFVFSHLLIKWLIKGHPCIGMDPRSNLRLWLIL